MDAKFTGASPKALELYSYTYRVPMEYFGGYSMAGILLTEVTTEKGHSKIISSSTTSSVFCPDE